MSLAPQDGGLDKRIQSRRSFAPALPLNGARGRNSLPHDRRGLWRRLGRRMALRPLLKGYGTDFNLKIDPVQKRPRELAEILIHHLRGTSALFFGVSEVAAVTSPRCQFTASRSHWENTAKFSISEGAENPRRSPSQAPPRSQAPSKESRPIPRCGRSDHTQLGNGQNNPRLPAYTPDSRVPGVLPSPTGQG